MYILVDMKDVTDAGREFIGPDLAFTKAQTRHELLVTANALMSDKHKINKFLKFFKQSKSLKAAITNAELFYDTLKDHEQMDYVVKDMGDGCVLVLVWIEPYYLEIVDAMRAHDYRARMMGRNEKQWLKSFRKAVDQTYTKMYAVSDVTKRYGVDASPGEVFKRFMGE